MSMDAFYVLGVVWGGGGTWFNESEGILIPLLLFVITDLLSKGLRLYVFF